LAKSKCRLWSRPMVAALFFLQPIYRGGARYKSRLNPGASASITNQKNLGQINDLQKLDRAEFWSKNGVDRYSFLQAFLQKLKSHNYPHKLDSGWSSHDLEIYKGRWAWLRLTTASEELGHNKIFMRFRLQAGWSFFAKLIFTLFVVAIFIAILQLASIQPWVWMAWLALPLFIWQIQQNKWNLQAQIVFHLEAVAEQLRLERYKSDEQKTSLPSNQD
jgi:hypothetical protein